MRSVLSGSRVRGPVRPSLLFFASAVIAQFHMLTTFEQRIGWLLLRGLISLGKACYVLRVASHNVSPPLEVVSRFAACPLFPACPLFDAYLGARSIGKNYHVGVSLTASPQVVGRFHVIEVFMMVAFRIGSPR